MGFDLGIFADESLSEQFVEYLIEQQWPDIQGHFSKLWAYYGNEMRQTAGAGDVDKKLNESSRPYVQAQEYGLPARITGLMRCGELGVFGGRALRDVQRKEVVIENDIGWRINAMVDFLFGKPVRIVSKSPDGDRRAEIETLLNGVFEANGDVLFFQDMAVLGGVYGFVDCLLRPGNSILEHTFNHSLPPATFAKAVELAQTIQLELIEAPRALPVLDENDYKKTRYYVQHFYQQKNAVSPGVPGGLLRRLLFGGRSAACRSRQTSAVTEITGPGAWQRYEDRQLVAEGQTPWGFVPVVHIQNMAQPYYYEGISDVEPLVPLQDELNTRQSDRANRITFQSFKMYLAKGLEGVEDRPVAPGRMWCTDNPDAGISEFGGDERTPSEDLHIAEIREAMDKTSGVTPMVAGVLKSRLGNLTSAVALKLTLMGMLAKTERKKFTYGQGIKTICRMVLAMLDAAGIYPTEALGRDFEVVFANPLPEDVMDRLKQAQIKKQLGVPAEQLLKELGYEPV
jgi:hypothetical protein